MDSARDTERKLAELDAGPAETIRNTVRDHLDRRELAYEVRVPDGLRLEMHRSVRSAVMRDTYRTGSDWDTWASAVEVPVTTTVYLPFGTWRLVIVTEDVLLDGKWDV